MVLSHRIIIPVSKQTRFDGYGIRMIVKYATVIDAEEYSFSSSYYHPGLKENERKRRR